MLCADNASLASHSLTLRVGLHAYKLRARGPTCREETGTSRPPRMESETPIYREILSVVIITAMQTKPNQTYLSRFNSIRFQACMQKKNGRMDSIQMPMLLCYIATTPSVPIYINDPIIKILYRNIIIHKERIKLNKLVSG